MSGTMKAEGMAELSEMLQRMEENASKVASMALYDGAGIMADEINRQAAGIQTAPFHYAVFITRQPSPEEKDLVMQGAGIAKFDKNGTEVGTSVGYGNAGYGDLKGKQVPIPKIVNAINSGTSFMQKQPFVRKAEKAGGTRAMQAMKESIERNFDAMTK